VKKVKKNLLILLKKMKKMKKLKKMKKMKKVKKKQTVSYSNSMKNNVNSSVNIAKIYLKEKKKEIMKILVILNLYNAKGVKMNFKGKI